ncbi:MAG: LPS export ABC transporter permease LptF [Rickettsiales bacterium]
MRQYERYLFMHLLWPTVIVTASLTAIVWLTQILKFLDFMLKRGLSFGDFMYLSGLMLPSLLFMLVPIALCIGVIYTYNRLMVESELIVLNAVGVSKWQLAKPAIMMGLACMVLCFLISLYILPLANSKFQDIRTFFRDKYASVLLEEEVFNNPIDGVTVYVRARDNDNNLSGILMHDSRNESETITMIADTGRMEQTPAGPRFYLYHGMRQQWKEGRVSWLAFDNYAIDIAFYGQDVTRSRNADERTIGELFNREGLTEKQSAAYRAEAHQRLTWPLLALSLPVFALAMLFSSEFNRRGQLKRMLLSTAGMVVIMLLYFTCRSASLKHGWMTAGLYVIVLGVLAGSSYLLLSARVITLRRKQVFAPIAGEA